MASDEIARRVQALEDREAICALKSAYLAACDGKDPAAMRACFVDGPVRIDYGALGTFDRAYALVAIFTQIACHDYMVEMHQGVNPQITLIDHERARGHWGLHYQLINTQEKKLTQLGAYYDDEYRKTASGWKMEATRCVVTSTLVLDLGAAAIASLFAGRPG